MIMSCCKKKFKFEQRLCTSFGRQCAPKTGFEVSLQYRLGDYTKDLKLSCFLLQVSMCNRTKMLNFNSILDFLVYKNRDQKRKFVT